MRRKEYSSNATAVAVVLMVLLITEIGGSYGCIQPERQALLNLKRRVILPDNTLPFPSWEGDGDCCEWEGIVCDNVTRHIVMLDLNNPCSLLFYESNIESRLSSYGDYCPTEPHASEDVTRYLSQLQHLTYLDLSGVVLLSPIPATFLGSMQRLRYLSLQGEGDIPSNSIGNLTNLRALYLKGLTPTNGTASTWLASLSSLQYLGLQGIDLSMEQAHHLFKVLDTLPALLHLHLPFCRLEEVFSSLVSDPIFHLTNLTRLQLLNLAWNDLNQDSPVLHTFQNTTSIKVLDISGNLLNSVPSWLAKLHNLVKLGLSCNNIIVLDPLRNLTSIRNLQLAANKNLNSLPLWFTHFDNLQVLSLTMCGFAGQLPSTLQNMTSIRSLDLSKNSLHSIVPLWLGKFENLVILVLSENMLYGPIPYALRNLTSLAYLDLSHNNLNQIIGSIPESLQDKISTLRFLLLNDNLINGSLPSSLGKLESLYRFDVSNNKLSGEIPSTIWNLSSLAWLHLNNNKFSKLPSSVTNMKELTLLDLGENKLSSFIPSWNDSNFPHLQILRMRRNWLYGRIPLSLCQFDALQILDLAENKLVGPIPHCIGNISGMTSAYNVSSSVESRKWGDEHMKQVIKGRELDYINNLKYVVNLDLSNNFLSGSIPTGISFLSGLIGFNLSYNNLFGEIPEMIGDMTSLESIDLSHNHLCGAIPRSMIDLTFLSHLNLSFNNLSGPIPVENQFQTFNDPLSYTDNQYLCGAPLPKYCPGDGPHHVPNIEGYENEDRENDKLDKVLFYSVITLGFATGFWGILGVLYFKKNWRYVCFGYVDKVADKIYVAVVLKVAKLKEMVQRNQSVKLEV